MNDFFYKFYDGCRTVIFWATLACICYCAVRAWIYNRRGDAAKVLKWVLGGMGAVFFGALISAQIPTPPPTESSTIWASDEPIAGSSWLTLLCYQLHFPVFVVLALIVVFGCGGLLFYWSYNQSEPEGVWRVLVLCAFGVGVTVAVLDLFWYLNMIDHGSPFTSIN
jgi:hypothetical protein